MAVRGRDITCKCDSFAFESSKTLPLLSLSMPPFEAAGRYRRPCQKTLSGPLLGFLLGFPSRFLRQNQMPQRPKQANATR